MDRTLSTISKRLEESIELLGKAGYAWRNGEDVWEAYRLIEEAFRSVGDFRRAKETIIPLEDDFALASGEIVPYRDLPSKCKSAASAHEAALRILGVVSQEIIEPVDPIDPQEEGGAFFYFTARETLQRRGFLLDIDATHLAARLKLERAKVLATIPAGHPPEHEAPDGVSAEFREGGKPDGHPLTANYFLTDRDTEVTWGFKNKGKSFLSKQHRERKLTLRKKVGTSAAYAYNYKELLALREELTKRDDDNLIE